MDNSATATDFAKMIKKFVDDGNITEGPPPLVKGTFQLKWEGIGSKIIFSEGSTLTNVNIHFRTGGNQLTIGKKTSVKGKFELGDGSRIYVGDETTFNRACDMHAREGTTLTIENRCLLSNVSIRTSDMHSVIDNTNKRINCPSDVIIEDDVWIGEFATIYKGVRVGKGSIVAGASVVTRSVPPLCLVAGNPAIVKESGVQWQRKIIPTSKNPIKEIRAQDVPLNKEVIQELINQKKFGLVLEIIRHHISRHKSISKLPVFAQWYYVKLRADAGALNPADESVLREILVRSPNHKPASQLLSRLIGG